MASAQAPFPVGVLRSPRANAEPARPPGQFEPSSRAASRGSLAKDPCIFQKTRLCKFYPKGQCTRGHSCTFAHGKEQLMPAPELFKTRLCIGFFRTGACQSGEACRFAHSLEELRPVTAPEDPRGGRTAQAAGPQPADPGLAAFTDREAILREIESMRQRAEDLQASQQGSGGRASPGMQETMQRQLDLMQKQAQMLQVQLQALQALAGRRLPGPAAAAPFHPPGPVLPTGPAPGEQQVARAAPPQLSPSDPGVSASCRAHLSPKKPAAEGARIPGFSRQTTMEPPDDVDDSRGLLTGDFSRQSTATGTGGEFSRQSTAQAPAADSARQPAPPTDQGAGKGTARGSRDEAPQSIAGPRAQRPLLLPGSRSPLAGGPLRRAAAEGAAVQFVGSPLASDVIRDELEEDDSPALPRISYGRFWSDQAVPLSLRSEEPLARPRPAAQPVREAPRLSLSIKNTFLHVQGGGAAAARGPRSRSTPPEAHDPPAAP